MNNKLDKYSQPAIPLVGTEVWAAMHHSIPTVTRFISGVGDEFINLKVNYRGTYDYLAVAKRYGKDGTPEVCFGSGSDFVGCLLGLEQALENDKWRPDKYAIQDQSK